MNDPSRRGRSVFLLAAAAVAAYGIYQWQKAGPSPAAQNPPIASLPIRDSQPTAVPTMASSVLTTPPPAKSLFELHTAFRESQRCMEERIIIRAKSYNPDGASPPQHIPGCDDMMGAQRKVYEATTAAAKAGDVDAQMCYLMQGGGDRESGFRLTDTEIAEYQSLGAQYVDAAFKRGDWRVVELLGYRVVDWAGMFINLKQWQDPTREYKAHRLLLLGAGDADPQDPNNWLGVLRMTESNGNSKLSPQEMQDSDAWAQTAYDKYFVSQPILLKEPRVCTADDES